MATRVFFDTTGRIRMAIAGDAQTLAEQRVPEGCSDLCSEDTVFAHTHYVREGQLAPIPDPPQASMRFAHAEGRWVRDEALAWWHSRQERNRLLEASDWTDTLSARTRLGSERYEAWQHYRQLLRDLTFQSDPYAIVWPEPPQSA